MILLLVGATERVIGVVREVAGSARIQIRTETSPDTPDWVITSTSDQRAEAIRLYGLQSFRVIELHDLAEGGERARDIVRTALARMADIGGLPPRHSRIATALAKRAIPLLTEWGTWLAVDEARQRIAAHKSFVESKLGAAAKARVLFMIPDVSAFPALSGLLTRLSDEGHQAHVAISTRSGQPVGIEAQGLGLETRGESLQDLRGITIERSPRSENSPWRPLAAWLRVRLHVPVRSTMRPLMAWIERGLPPELDLIGFIEDRKPDVLALVPHRTADSIESDFIRTARRLGVPSIYLPLRWDDLETPEHRQPEWPDTVAAWNEAQARDFSIKSGIAPNRIRVTGALLPSDVVDGRPAGASSRERYCARLGIASSHRIILFEAPPESTRTFIEHFHRLRNAVKESADPEVRGAAVVVYVHNPDEVAVWRRLSATAEIAVARAGEPDRAPFRLSESLMAADVVIASDLPLLLEAGARSKPAIVLLRDQANPDSELERFCSASASRHAWPTVARNIDDVITQLSAGLRPASAARVTQAAPVRPDDSEPAAASVCRLLEELAQRRPARNDMTTPPATWRRLIVLGCAWLARRRDAAITSGRSRTR